MQPLLLTLDEGYLLMAAPPILEHGVAPLDLLGPVQPLLLDMGLLYRLSHQGSPRIFIAILLIIIPISIKDFPDGSDGKASVYSAGDPGSIPGSGRSLEEEMAVHSRTIAWKTPWMEESGSLQSMGSQRVGHY